MPVSPAPSWREPTRYVMFTVTVDCVGSANNSTRSPLSSTYSSMPSSERTRRGGAGGGAGVTGVGVVGAIAMGVGAVTGTAPGRAEPAHAAIVRSSSRNDDVSRMGPRCRRHTPARPPPVTA